MRRITVVLVLLWAAVAIAAVRQRPAAMRYPGDASQRAGSTLQRPFAPPGSPAAPSCGTLCDDLVSYWSLDEVSGTRADAVGSADLTDNNTVGVSLAGPSGTVASFVRDNVEYLSGTKITSGEAGEGVTIACWFKHTAGADYPLILGTNSQTTVTDGIAFYLQQTNLKVRAGLDGIGDIDTPAVVVPADGSWHYAVGWVDPADNKVYLSVDLGTPVASAAQVTATLNGGTGGLLIGGGWTYGSIQGAIANAGVWSGVLAEDERTSLFNSGVGKSYADLTTAEKVGLVSYWDLSEASGTRVDSHGSNDLTDNNTVGSVTNSGGAMHNAAASFVAANSEKLTHEDSAALRVGADDFTIALWVKPSAINGVPFPMSKGGQGEYCFDLYLGAPRFYTRNGGAYPTASWGSTVALNEWHLLIGWRDSTGLKNYLQVDNGTPVSGSMASVVDEDAAAGEFSIGWAVDGQVDEAMKWSRVLTSDERAELYASGSGVFYDGSVFADLFLPQPWRYAANDNQRNVFFFRPH